MGPNIIGLVFLYKGGIWRQTCIERRRCEDTKGEDGNLEARENGLGQILLSQPSEGKNPVDTLILDFQLPELWDNTFLGGCFSPPVCGAYSSLRKSKQLDTRGRT